jgi:hypothetical protein
VISKFEGKSKGLHLENRKNTAEIVRISSAGKPETPEVDYEPASQIVNKKTLNQEENLEKSEDLKKELKKVGLRKENPPRAGKKSEKVKNDLFKKELEEIENQEKMLQSEIQALDFNGPKLRLFESLQAIAEENKDMEETLGKNNPFAFQPSAILIKNTGNQDENFANQEFFKKLQQDYEKKIENQSIDGKNQKNERKAQVFDEKNQKNEGIAQVFNEKNLKNEEKYGKNHVLLKDLRKKSDNQEKNNIEEKGLKEIKVKQYVKNEENKTEPKVLNETEEFYENVEKFSPKQIKKYAGRGRVFSNDRKNKENPRGGSSGMRESYQSEKTKKSELGKKEIRDSKESLATVSKDYVRVNPKIDIKQLLYS